MEETILDHITEAFVISLLSVAVAELGDKTQLGLITLSASIRKPAAIFLGMVAGYIVIAGLAILVGQLLLAIIPLSTLTLISGVIFVGIGVLMLTMNVKSGVRSSRVKGPFLTTSLMIILTELGDKTQIVTIALAARFTEALAVFTGVLSAFVMIDGLSIILADRLGKRVRAGKVKKVSAIMFIVLGILTVLGML